MAVFQSESLDVYVVECQQTHVRQDVLEEVVMVPFDDDRFCGIRYQSYDLPDLLPGLIAGTTEIVFDVTQKDDPGGFVLIDYAVQGLAYGPCVDTGDEHPLAFEGTLISQMQVSYDCGRSFVQDQASVIGYRHPRHDADLPYAHVSDEVFMT